MKRLNEMMCAALLACALCAFGCSNSSASDDDETSVPVQPGDNVVFSNQTEFAVKVYSDSMRSVLVADVAAKKGVSSHVDVASAGNVFYFSYFMDVNGVSVPYGVTDGHTVMLDDGSATSVKITDPQVVNTNKRIILLKNDADSAIVLYNGNKEERPEGKSSALVNSGDYGIYILGALDDIANINIVEGIKSVPLSTAADFENGYIYTVVYDGAKIYMRSKGFLDRNMSKKIWKIGVSHEAGKTLVNEKLLVRGNQNGYVLYGRIGYDVNLSYKKTVPYYAYIDSTGRITTEDSFTFIDNPKCSSFIDAVEANGIRLALVEKTSSSDILSYSVMSDDNGYSIHESIAQNDDVARYEGWGILHKKDNIFCVLLESWNMNPDETYAFCQYELIEVIVEDYSSISTKKLCKSDDCAYLSPVSFAYDSSTDTYIVMSQPVDKHGDGLGMTQFSFIDGTTGDIKKDLKLEKYLFNKVKFNPNDGYAYASGSFVNQITGKDVASFAKIDISTGSVVSGKPVQYPCQNSSLYSNFDDFVIDGDTIILGGYTNADYEMGENTNTSPSITTCPYIVSYNAKEGKTIYEREYENLKGFKICGINFSEIGSLLLGIFSDLTGEGYIVSTGLLGELPEETKLTLPQSTSIKPIAAPDYYTVLFESDCEQYIDPYTVQRGKEIAVAPEVRKEGVAFAGWFLDKGFNQRVEFPYVPDSDTVLYAEWKSPPELVSCTSTRISSSCVEIQITPSDDKYFECYHIICYKTGTSRTARVASRNPPVRELFLDVKTKDSFYKINGPEGTYLINLYVIDTFGQQSKVYAATIF
ncbi:MAG: InlB B-repeat-containing protein [Treponema sp.]|nr:InlB B-repeat-containing protein [Treponema sp.]